MKKEFESKFNITIYVFSLVFTLLYILYRIFFTIPNNEIITIIIAVIVLSFETIDALFFTIYVFNILIYNKNSPKIPNIKNKTFPEVDVFIASLNEEEELLTNTINACKKMNYPNKKKIHIYLCDDGNRKNIKNLCNKLEINYICRDNNKNNKAGNYNNALKKTKSPYIATFDADMQPNENFLLKTIPYLINNEKLGFVQLPQSFKDYDLFQRKFKLKKQIPSEQNYFYHKIQLAKNNTNSVIYCGTNAVISRKALKAAGGFATKTIAEDIATGMLIEQSGYQALALPDDEVYGLNVTSTESLLKQRSRWCRGCIQTLKNYLILTNKNLSFQQKLDYLSAIYYWSFGIRTIFYLLVPLLFSFFDIRIIQSNIYVFLAIFFIQYIFKRFLIDKIEKNCVSSTWNRIYEIVLSPIIAYESIKEILGFGNLKFEVTAKTYSKNKFPIRSFLTYITHLLLSVLTILGILVSYYKGSLLGFENYTLPLFWLGTNLIYLTIAIIFDCSNKNITEKENRKITNKYSIFSTPLIFFQYLKYQFRLKEILSGAFLIFLLIASINYITPTSNPLNLVSYNGYLSIKNGILVNKHEKPIQLRGVSTHNLHYFEQNYTYNNIKTLKKTWGINVFRIAMYTEPDEEGYIKNKNIKEKVEQLIDYCIDLDLYVIIDWHILKDNNPNTYKEEAKEFFNELSKKYQDVPNVIYEICNEPNGKEVTWDTEIKPYAEELISTIRKNYNDAIILVGTPNWSKDLEPVRKNPIKDENTMYVVHTYPKGEIDKIQTGIENAMKDKLPIMITECAATDPTGDGKLHKSFLRNWIKYLEKNHISWIAWQFSDKYENSSLLIPKELKEKEWLEEKKKTKKQIEKEKYNLNNYLSEEGKLIKELIKKYSKRKSN